jgi:hypothetical protein
MRGERALGCVAGAVMLLAAAAGATATGAREAGDPPACAQRVSHGVLPTWARAGFSDPRPRIAHSLGRAGLIAAVLFGEPLRSPPSRVHSNKILWVPRTQPSNLVGALRISAQRMDGTRPVGTPVRRSVQGGPGPSIIDLPAAGCWRLVLRWPGATDSLDLVWSRGP